MSFKIRTDNGAVYRIPNLPMLIEYLTKNKETLVEHEVEIDVDKRWALTIPAGILDCVGWEETVTHMIQRQREA